MTQGATPILVYGLDPSGIAKPLKVDSSGNLLVQTGAAGGGNIATAQISVGATATILAAARPTRATIQIKNTGGGNIFIGGSGVTKTTGLPLPGSAGSQSSITLTTTAALYAIADDAGSPAAVIEIY